MMEDYERKASAFLEKYGFTITIKECPYQTSPNWSSPEPEKLRHGIKYDILIEAKDGRVSLSFPFWDSIYNMENGLTPTEYHVLACVSGESQNPTDPDEVYEEFGNMKPSQARDIATFTKLIQSFFRPEELADLREIQ
jgi:hypothetical protein